MKDRTASIDGTDYTIVSNGHTRPIVELVFDDNDGWRLPLNEDEYLGGKSLSSGFIYRGEAYALSEFDRAGAHMQQLGFDGFQSSSYFDGIAVRYYRDEYTDGIDYDNGIVVAHIHW